MSSPSLIADRGRAAALAATGWRSVLARGQFWFAALFVAGWSGVICGGLLVQFAQREYPCPLCVVQRMFMTLALLGPAYILRCALGGTVGRRDYMLGWGLALLGCAAGSIAAWRQTMLHILPGDEGYGTAVLGLHLYVWALILFQASVVATGLLLALAHDNAERSIPRRGPYHTVATFALTFATIVIAANLVAVLCEQGVHWYLPEEPSRYQLFYDLHLL